MASQFPQAAAGFLTSPKNWSPRTKAHRSSISAATPAASVGVFWKMPTGARPAAYAWTAAADTAKWPLQLVLRAYVVSGSDIGGAAAATRCCRRSSHSGWRSW